MGRKIGPVSPDSGAGNAGLRVGRGPTTSMYSRGPRISDAKLNQIFKAMNQARPSRPTTNSIIGSYKPLNSSSVSTSTNYGLPVGLAIIGGAAIAGSNAAKERIKKEAIKRASYKTRKGQSRGR